MGAASIKGDVLWVCAAQGVNVDVSGTVPTVAGVRRRARRTSPARFFPGWIVVGAAFVLLMANSGFIFYGQAVYLDALTDERGFSTGAASLGQSLVFVVGGLVGPLIGRLITDHDVRVVVSVGLLMPLGR